MTIEKLQRYVHDLEASAPISMDWPHGLPPGNDNSIWPHLDP